VLLTFSPWIILLIFSWKEIILLRKVPVVRRLIVWLVVGLIFTLIPYDLQRRFMIGLSIPFTALGLLVLPSAAHRLRLSTRKALIACAAVILPTPILLMVMTTMAIASHNPLYYYYRGEMEGIVWLSGQGNGRQLVMASGQTGNMIPAASRLRVVYGHPFETIQAESEEQAVTDFFAGTGSMESEIACLDSRQIDWILYGPREKEIGLPVILEGKEPTMQFSDMAIYDVRELLN
jgi:hypothetical protein